MNVVKEQTRRAVVKASQKMTSEEMLVVMRFLRFLHNAVTFDAHFDLGIATGIVEQENAKTPFAFGCEPTELVIHDLRDKVEAQRIALQKELDRNQPLRDEVREWREWAKKLGADLEKAQTRIKEKK
jgi:hypothetical protein